MYEHMRNAFIAKLSAGYSRIDIERITAALDNVANDYEISEKCTELAVLTDPIPQEARLYLASKRLEGLAEGTLKNYRAVLRIFFEHLQKQPADITTNDIRLYLATYQMQSKISDRRLDKIREVLSAFFAWLCNEEYIARNPCKNILPIRYEKKPRKALTRYQLEKLRRMITDTRERAILDVLFSTGCRVNELVNIKLSDIDFETKSIHIIGKGSKHNTVYLNDIAYLSIQEYIKTRKGDSEYLFTGSKYPYGKLAVRSVQKIIGKYKKPLGCELSPHIIRHTTATLSLQAGMPITQVQKILGHASVSTTQIYAETLQDDVRQSHKKYVV